MSKRLQVTDSLALAFGFHWLVLDPFQSRSVKLAELLAQGNRWQASFKRAGNDYLGVSREDFTPVPKVRTVSGAAQMARHPKLLGQTVWVVMEEPGTDAAPELAVSQAGARAASEMVVVGLLNGNIVIDDYVDMAGYHKQHAAFQERCKKAKATYSTAGTSYGFGKLAQALSWADFLPARANSPVPVKALEPGVQGRVLALLAVTAALATIGWGYVRWDDARQADLERERRAKAMRNIPAMYSAAVDEILARPVLRANRVFAELRERLHSFPLKFEGWSLHKIECLAATAACTATWLNASKLGTNRGFAEAAPRDWTAVTFARSGEEVKHRLPFTLSSAAMPARDAWPQGRDFLLRQFSQWQSYWIVGFRPELIAASRIVGLVPGLDEESAASFPDATWATAWSIEKTDWYLSEGFDVAPEKGDANLPDSVTVDAITLLVNQNNELKFDANGLIYERK